MSRGLLLIVSGPSGSGKTSLCSALLKQSPNLSISISCTTRAARRGELDGQHYHFLSQDDFQQQCAQGAFLEYAQVHGNAYGTRKQDVEALLAKGVDVLLEIDWQGAAQVAKQWNDVCRIFILPPSLAVLRQRLQARGQDAEVVIQARVDAAEAEMAHAGEAEFVLLNDDFEQTLDDLRCVYRAHALRHFDVSSFC